MVAMTLSSVGSTTQSVQEESISATSDSSTKSSSANKTTTANIPADTVQLSTAAQAKLMKHQGQSVSQIANSLALTTKTVDEYLGITESTTEAALAALTVVSVKK